jgi:tRNA (adenine22-N1)-methyltransferase
MIKLSKRLLACANYTQGFQSLADIGTDHALLPIYCIKEGNVLNALAIDNKEGPFVIAYSNVLKNNLSDRIKVLKSDGIKDISDETDVVVISGMGGSLIKDILLKDDIKNVKRFILQPNIDAVEIRQILPQIGFFIVDEIVIKDSNKYYEILVIERGSREYSDLELEFGPINLQHKSHYFMEKYQKELKQYEKLVSTVPKEHKSEIEARIKVLQEALQ